MKSSKPLPKRPVDILSQALPRPNPAWTGISARTNSGPNLLHARPAASASEVSKAKSELFGRITARQLHSMMGLEAQGSAAEGESILGASLASRSQPLFSSVPASATSPSRSAVAAAAAGAGEGEEPPPPEVLVLDIRPVEAAEAFAAVRLVGALHVPFSLYMTQDKLPASMHAAKRQKPQPVIVLYDDCTGRAMDGPDFAGKLIQAGGYDAVMLLAGGLRSAAMEEPRLVEGSRAQDYVSGVRAEVRRAQGGHGLKLPAGGQGGSPSAGSAGRSPESMGRSVGGGGGKQGAAGSSARSVGSFGSSRRF